MKDCVPENRNSVQHKKYIVYKGNNPEAIISALNRRNNFEQV